MLLGNTFGYKQTDSQTVLKYNIDWESQPHSGHGLGIYDRITDAYAVHKYFHQNRLTTFVSIFTNVETSFYLKD